MPAADTIPSLRSTIDSRARSRQPFRSSIRRTRCNQIMAGPELVYADPVSNGACQFFSATGNRVEERRYAPAPLSVDEADSGMCASLAETDRLAGAPDVHVLVVGAAGMLGRKLVERLCRDRVVGESRVTRLTLVDAVTPTVPASAAPFPVESLSADLADAGVAERLVAAEPDLVFQPAG